MAPLLLLALPCAAASLRAQILAAELKREAPYLARPDGMQAALRPPDNDEVCGVAVVVGGGVGVTAIDGTPTPTATATPRHEPRLARRSSARVSRPPVPRRLLWSLRSAVMAASGEPHVPRGASGDVGVPSQRPLAPSTIAEAT